MLFDRNPQARQLPGLDAGILRQSHAYRRQIGLRIDLVAERGMGLILVSHDRSLLRATTDRFLLVSDGRCIDFDGDLDDYRAWSLKKSSGNDVPSKPAPASGEVPATPTNINTRDRRRLDATARDAIAKQKKPIEQRIRRLEARMAEADAKKRAIDAALAQPNAYAEERREQLKQQLIDQAYVTREIEELEAEWLEQHALLERAA